MRKRKNIDIKRILELTKEGLTLEQIAGKEHVSLVTLYERIKKAQGTPEHEEYKTILKSARKGKRRPKRKNIDIKRIIELTKEGLELKQIADKENVSHTTLCNRIKEAEGTPEYEEYKKVQKNIDIKRIVELTKEGLTLKQIADKENVSLTTLCNRIKEAEGTPEHKEYKNIKEHERKDINMNRILELTKQGLTLVQIHDQEGVCIDLLYKRIRKAQGTPEYEEYMKAKLPRKERDSSKKIKKKQYIGIIPDNKRLLVFMLGNGATPEEITEIYVSRGLEMNAREQLEQYIADIHKGRLKPTALERNMMSYIRRLLNIKMEDIAELEGLVTNKSPIHRISSKTNLEELVQQYNIKSGKTFSRLELEFVLNRIKNANKNIPVSPYIIPEGETLLSKIEDMYDSIQLDRFQTIR